MVYLNALNFCLGILWLENHGRKYFRFSTYSKVTYLLLFFLQL